MGCNLSRRPEQERALAFRRKARAARQAATAVLVVGLQLAEQRAAHGLASTTLALALYGGGSCGVWPRWLGN